MTYRIFDHVSLATHGAVQAIFRSYGTRGLPSQNGQRQWKQRGNLFWPAWPYVQRRTASCVGRRAASLENPSVRLYQLALELGVSERYLVAGLRTVPGVSSDLIVRPLKARRDAA